MMNPAIRDRMAAIPIPLQPVANQPMIVSRMDEIPHHFHASESINGSLTKRRKYSLLSSFPIRVANGSLECESKPTTPWGPLGKIVHFSRYGSTAMGKNRSLLANRRTGSYFFNSSESSIELSRNPQALYDKTGTKFARTHSVNQICRGEVFFTATYLVCCY